VFQPAAPLSGGHRTRRPEALRPHLAAGLPLLDARYTRVDKERKCLNLQTVGRDAAEENYVAYRRRREATVIEMRGGGRCLAISGVLEFRSVICRARLATNDRVRRPVARRTAFPLGGQFTGFSLVESVVRKHPGETLIHIIEVTRMRGGLKAQSVSVSAAWDGYCYSGNV
jgi:hypothetical protein